jgi:hypothetical protein
LQPDSLIPDPSNPQAWNRFSYVMNRPVNFNDPTGHSVDCGFGDPFCNAGKYKPGGLISLYKHYYGKDSLDKPYNSPKPIRDRLSQEIEDYLNDNSDYRKDNLLGGPVAGSDNYGLFSSIRNDYWQNRCEKSGGCDLLTEPEKLYRYYDLHENIQITMFDPSRIKWVDLGLDSASLALSVVSLNSVSKSAQAVVTNFGAQGFGAFSGAKSFAKGDNTGGWLSVGGFAPPPFGTLASGASVIRDFSAGFYYVPYVPPVTR